MTPSELSSSGFIKRERPRLGSACCPVSRSEEINLYYSFGQRGSSAAKNLSNMNSTPQNSLDDFSKASSEELFSLVYADLQRRARSCMASANGALTIQPTALVHEAWIKLESGGTKQWKNKAHFMGTAVRAMRCLLIDHARSRSTKKRGGGRTALPLEEELLISDDNAETFIQLDESLEALATLDRELASVVELRFFAGLTDEEIAASLDLSVDQAKKAWAMARAWLKQRLKAGELDERKSA